MTRNIVCYCLLALMGVSAMERAHAQTRPATTQAAAVQGPERWRPQIEKFEAADREQMPAPGGVVFVGSSSILGWKVSEAFPDANAINRGFGGSQSADAAYYAERIITPYKPRLVIFYAGENDIAAKKSPKDVLEGFRTFVETVRRPQPHLEIIFISLKPSPKRWHLREQFQQANDLIRGYVDEQEHMAFIDVWPDMLGPDGEPRAELFRKDMLHLNEQGYAIWNDKVRPYVAGEK